MNRRFFISFSRWVAWRRSVGLALAVCLALGTVTLPEVWATTYYVDDGAGNDSRTPAEAQNPATPWQTLSRAVSEPALTSGDVISVAAGLYDSGLGESFPLTLVGGVQIQGEDLTNTTISAPAAVAAFQNVDTDLSAITTISGFTVTHDAADTNNVGMSFSLASAAMEPLITDNHFVGLADNGVGINVVDSASTARSFTAVIEDNSFSNWYEGVMAQFRYGGEQSELSPIIHGNNFDGNNRAVSVDVNEGGAYIASPVVSDNQISNSDSVGVYTILDHYGSNAHDATFEPVISGNTVTGSGSDAIGMYVSYLSPLSSSDVVTFSPTVLNNVVDGTIGSGIDLYYYNEDAVGTFVSTVTIAGNTVTNATANGIEVSAASWSDAFNMDLDIMINNNTITTSYTGIAIDLTETVSYASGDIDITVAGNTITSTTGTGIEIEISSMYSTCTFDLAMNVQGNVVQGAASDGIDLLVGYQEGFTSSRTDVLDNVVDGSGADGLTLAYGDFISPTSYVLAACNAVSNSGGWDVWLADDWSNDAPPPDFGGGDLASPGLNSFTSAGAFYNYEDQSVDAHSNWWGTTDDATIDSHIFDDDEDPSRGEVLYSGWLSGPPSVTATATLTDMVLIDGGPAGASPGDTIRYTATLQGTGDCGCSAASFSVAIPVNGTYVDDSLTASRGLLINEAVSALHPELIVGLGALGASETVTITWDVVAGAGCTMASQAILSCHQLGDVLTDDPDAAGGIDATVTALGTDLAIHKTDGVATAASGQSTTYTITVTSTCDAVGATVNDVFPTAFTNVSWNCVPSPGSVCGSGVDNLVDTVTVIAGGSLVYTAAGTIDAGFTGLLENTASVAPPAGLAELDSTNDSDSDSTMVVAPLIFADGFDSGDTSAWSATRP